MKFIRFLLFITFFIPGVVFGASTSDFQNAAKLLTAARRGDIQTVQVLINSGVDVNFVDSTGLSLVCTAVMNNDKRAIQILQMYGADASKCDRQIKKYKEKSRTAINGKESGFFSGLSSSHVLALSAIGVAAVVGGVVLLDNAFDKNNNNSGSSGGGSHGGGGGGSGGGSVTPSFVVPYAPAYLTADGALDTGFDITENLPNWDTRSTSALRVTDFNYLRTSVSDNFVSDGLNSFLQNYLLVMRGYYSLASGYMGQNIFRDNNNSNVPVLPAVQGAQGRPVRVALITGDGINPAGAADAGDGITYAVSTALDASTPTVDKYLNNMIDNSTATETDFDFSGSGSAFNPFASVNDSALAKIVVGWDKTRSSDVGDLYGFVPNGQLAIYRTGDGYQWMDSTSQTNVGLFTDADNDEQLSSGDTVEIGGESYDIIAVADDATITNQQITINGTTFDLASDSDLFIGKCAGTSSENCTNIAIYVGFDGKWYVNSSGGNDIDSVYGVNSNNIYVAKEKTSTNVYNNFKAITKAVGTTYSVPGDTTNIGVDVIANTDVISASRGVDYLSVKNFTKAATMAGVSDLKTFYSNMVDSWYGTDQGGVANSLFNNYYLSKPMLIMPAGDYLFKDATTGMTYYDTLDATFENYAPLIYGNNLNHNFMTVVAVSHEIGTSAATTITEYGDGINASYGKIRLSLWVDGTDVNTSNWYASRKCGIAGAGASASGIDPWCFAASGPTAEMATASMAGAVASLKSAFSYMTNDQIFTLLALTADGPYLATDSSGALMSTDTLVEYLKSMYELPGEYDEMVLSTDAYLAAFKDVFGYGLVNLQRATKPGFSVYYYDANVNNIVSVSGAVNKFWGNVGTNTSRASTVFSLLGRSSITTSFYDVLQSADGSLSLPRVWKNTFAADMGNKHGLYMGDVLGDFHIGTDGKQTQKTGDFEFSMAMSQRAYNDNLNGLDDLRVAFVMDDVELAGEYQRYLTDGESRFNGRANAVLGLASNVMLSDAEYKMNNFNFGVRAFSGVITDESLLEKDPVVSAQYEPGRLGLASGGAFNMGYSNDALELNMSVGVLHENNTVLGAYSDGLLALNGSDTRYIDTVIAYKPFDIIRLFARGTFATTQANYADGIISELSDIKSNAFALGADIGGFGFTFAMPLAVVNGNMGYGYADFDVVENDGHYSIAVNNAHTEYVDLSAPKRELRFTTSYRGTVDEMSDAGVEFMYRVNPYNTDAFGNESIFMFKFYHRIGV